MSLTQTLDSDSLIQKFRSVISLKSEASQQNYLKALRCLQSFLFTYSYSSLFPSPQTLADWFLNMSSRGISPKTAHHYLDIISALYGETLDTPDSSNPFPQFKADAKKILLLPQNSPIDEIAFNRLLKIIKSSSSQPKPLQLAADILLFSLLNRAMPLADIAKIKTSQIKPDSDAISQIIERNANPTRKYLFPLDQSKLTPRQLSDSIDRKVRIILLSCGITIVDSISNTIRLLWAHAALRCGIPGSEIISLIGTDITGIPPLSLCLKADLSPQRAEALSQTVNSLFSSNPLRWYAMKLRSRIDFQDLQRRFSDLKETTTLPELFYPSDEIAKRVGKKVVKDSRPVIRDIVFFKFRVTDIFPLFCKIGDLAWCFTTSGHPGGDYAPIPKASFDLFQETIGHFTPDYEIAPIGGFQPQEGESVVIIQGPLANYQFEVEKAKDTDRVIFQLNMIGDNGFQWRTSSSRRHLKPTP